MTKQREDRFVELEERFAGYTVYDANREKIGKVDDLFVDEDDNPEYIGVKTGFLGTKSTLIPIELIRVNDRRGLVEIAADKDLVKDGPSFDDDEEITPEYEDRVRAHYGPGRGRQGVAQRGAYGDYYERDEYHPSRSSTMVCSDDQRQHSGYRERDRSWEKDLGAAARSNSGEEEDELRVQRVEEELIAGTRELEAGRVNVRKRVRTDRERLRVPKRREEVSVERVSVDRREAAEAEIGEDEFVVPFVEEEVVVEKRPVVKEEIRLRKEVVEDEEVVERDVRKEEVDVDDQTERGVRHRGQRGTANRGVRS
jgi:uncharacterized protein (TIGR02271 family)